MNKIAYLERNKQGGIFSLEEDAVASAPNFVVALQGKSNLIEGKDMRTRPNEFGSMTARKNDRSQIKPVFCHKGPLKAIKGHTRPC